MSCWTGNGAAGPSGVGGPRASSDGDRSDRPGAAASRAPGAGQPVSRSARPDRAAEWVTGVVTTGRAGRAGHAETAASARPGQTGC